MQDNSQTSLVKNTGSMWNLDTLQSLIRAGLKIGGGFLVAKGLADESALEVVSAGLLAVVGIFWGIWHRAPAAPASPPPHQMPLLLLVGLLVAAGCASFDTKAFRAEQAAADSAYASLLTWKQFYRAAATNSTGQTSAQLQARNEQVYAASRLLSATLQSADTLREICLTNSASSNTTALQFTLRAAQTQSSNLTWLVNTSIGTPDNRQQP